MYLKLCKTVLIFFLFPSLSIAQEVIRINQLGYLPNGVKVAVWGTKGNQIPSTFQLIDSASNKIVFSGTTGKFFGKYGPFNHILRLNFSSYNKPGKYYLKTGNSVSPVFKINNNVYNGSADFVLNYMRQQQCGFNPYTKDSCHTHDGYTLYALIPDSTNIDVVGGWHDASDYLQYSTTSANATYHLLAAYRDFPDVFTDAHQANGLEGKNNIPDILDAAKWGVDWMLKMHPKDHWLFNQIADDRDHRGMRLPKEDTFYSRGFERPVYFCTGKPQMRKNFMNNSDGVASTAGKFSSTFALGFQVFNKINPEYAKELYTKAFSAYAMGVKQPGVQQTASVVSPYIYAEENYVDDMHLAAASLFNITCNQRYKNESLQFARKEKITPWLGKDTAKHYQWYPFINLGHYALGNADKNSKAEMIQYYKQGIELVWNKAKQNGFYRGIPFIWCSNNLTTSFAIQCLWYKDLSNDKTYDELMQANFDWLFGCNPWGTSMVYGLPAWGDTPVDPHAAFSKIGGMHVNGGLVDGPVYTTIYNNLIGIKLYNKDAYAEFQSDLAVYHDDYGDYSTNEPTMDGTASLIYLLAAMENKGNSIKKNFQTNQGAIVRGDAAKKQIALVFTGHEYADGAQSIINTLQKEKIKGSFFFTGDFYNTPKFYSTIKILKNNGHYLGAHSDKHLLYNDWSNRDSLLITKEKFLLDLYDNYAKMEKSGIQQQDAYYFLPPYEWYNQTIADWTADAGLQLINMTHGTLSHADYTTPDTKNYRSSKEIYDNIVAYEKANNLNGFLLLTHIGTHPLRKDKFYNYLPRLIQYLKQQGYTFVRVDELLGG